MTRQLQLIVELAHVDDGLLVVLCTHVNSAHLLVLLLVLALPLATLRLELLPSLLLLLNLILDVL